MLFKHPLKIDLFSLINKHIDNPDEYGALIDSLYSNNLKESSFEGLNGSKTHGFIYMSNKKHFTILSRDFYEKSFGFHHEGKFYRYTCSVNNCSEIKDIPKDTVRG